MTEPTALKPFLNLHPKSLGRTINITAFSPDFNYHKHDILIKLEKFLPFKNLFRDHHSHVDVDIKPGLAFKAIEALQAEEVDLVISADPENFPDVVFHELFTYEPTFIAAKDHPLSARDYVEAADFADQNVIT